MLKCQEVLEGDQCHEEKILKIYMNYSLWGERQEISQEGIATLFGIRRLVRSVLE